MEGACSEDSRTNLIINYLPQCLTEHELYKLFITVGPLKSCKIMKDYKTGYSYGFGFVDYERPEDARKAIAELNNLSLQHKNIKVSFARPAGEDIKETNLYIQNIPRMYTVDQLADLFAPYGMIVQKNILKDKITGASKGVGFIRFDKKSEASAAILGMNNIVPEGGTMPLTVRLAEEHGKAKSSYFAGYHTGVNAGGKGRGQFRPMMGGNGGGGPSMGGGFGRGNYYNNPNGGKMPIGRSGRRYNPLGGGGLGFGHQYHFPSDVPY